MYESRFQTTIKLNTPKPENHLRIYGKFPGRNIKSQ